MYVGIFYDVEPHFLVVSFTMTPAKQTKLTIMVYLPGIYYSF